MALIKYANQQKNYSMFYKFKSYIEKSKIKQVQTIEMKIKDYFSDYIQCAQMLTFMRKTLYQHHYKLFKNQGSHKRKILAIVYICKTNMQLYFIIFFFFEAM